MAETVHEYQDRIAAWMDDDYRPNALIWWPTPPCERQDGEGKRAYAKRVTDWLDDEGGYREIYPQYSGGGGTGQPPTPPPKRNN